MKIRAIIFELIVFSCALLFLYSALSKMLAISIFESQIANQVFPKVFTPYLTYGIPMVELLIAAALMLKRTALIGLLAFSALMLVFTFYIALILLGVFPRVPCGCATAFEHLSWRQHLLFNLAFTLAGMIGLWLYRNNQTKESMQDAMSDKEIPVHGSGKR